MSAGNERSELRERYCTAWQKHIAGERMDALEALIRDVVLDHPEYQQMLLDPEQALSADYTPEQGRTNPFLHMGMHIAIREQLSIDRPPGIRETYRRLLARVGDAHMLEHRMMECLGQVLWAAQSNAREPDMQEYLECIQHIDK